MNKRGWFIPILIVSVNALAIALQWAFLPESLPAHFDLDGNASGEMSRSALLLYPLLCIGHSHLGKYACFHVGGAVILLAAIVAFVVSIIRSRCSKI